MKFLIFLFIFNILQLDVTSMYDNLYGCREFVTELYDATIANTTIHTSFCLAPAVRTWIQYIISIHINRSLEHFRIYSGSVLQLERFLDRSVLLHT